MDPVFQEEQNHLAKIEGIIDAAANERRRKVSLLEADIADFYALDYEDIHRKKELIDQKKRLAAEEERYLGLKPSPYFGRIDLEEDDGGEPITNYIGKEAIVIDSKAVVIDWRSPMGECYYARNQSSFSINGATYSLALRRALSIQNAQLIDYRTEFDVYSVSLEGEVIDPFLLTVLQDKRRQRRLTDIIRSIQANQNDIIRRPLRESFIVQGCAGSGKTMILLHRLSYLKFNNRSLSLSGIKIITPNPSFNAHIDELSAQLGIDMIEKFTVEEYYVHLIQQYSRIFKVDAAVLSEGGLSPELLGEIYSAGFVATLQEQYHAYWEAVLATIDEAQLQKSFQLHGLSYPSTDVHSAATATALEHGLVRIIAEFNERAEKCEEYQRRKAAIENDCERSGALQAKLAEEAAAVLVQMQELARTELATISAAIARVNDDALPARERLQELSALDGGALESARRAEMELAALRNNYAAYADFDSFGNARDAISSGIASTCNDQIAQIHALEERLQRTPAYNFVRRNSLRRQLQAARNDFSQAARRYLDSLIAEKEAARSEFNSATRAHREEIAKLSGIVEVAEQDIAELRRRQRALEAWILKLNTAPEASAPPEGAPQRFDMLLNEYRETVASMNEQAEKQERFRKQLEKLEAQSQAPYDEDIRALEAASAAVAKLSAAEIHRQVIRKALLQAYAAHGEKYTKENYRHKLFLLLLFCSWYYARLPNADTYLNIDEAQDISVAEYALLRKILGDGCVFNLYGDINQSLFPERCILDWEELNALVGGNIFVLNENYRNTLQITDYCNQAFSAEIYPIGIQGVPVAEMRTDRAVPWLLNIKWNHPDFRAAIILHKPNDATEKKLKALLGNASSAWYAVDNQKISILTVEQAKGLEFDAVVVLCAGMEINEQYIAYTRALDQLCIASD